MWTVKAERVVKNTLACHKKPGWTPDRFELWVTGAVSPLARRQLEAQGIKVVENVDRRISILIDGLLVIIKVERKLKWGSES